VSASRIDDLFNPDRLRASWVPAPVAPPPPPDAGPPVPPAIALVDRLAAVLKRDLSGREAALGPVVARLRERLVQAEGDPAKPEPKKQAEARAAIPKALDGLEDLIEALMLANS
jgi:hypothetical protein